MAGERGQLAGRTQAALPLPREMTLPHRGRACPHPAPDLVACRHLQLQKRLFRALPNSVTVTPLCVKIPRQAGDLRAGGARPRVRLGFGGISCSSRRIASPRGEIESRRHRHSSINHRPRTLLRAEHRPRQGLKRADGQAPPQGRWRLPCSGWLGGAGWRGWAGSPEPWALRRAPPVLQAASQTRVPWLWAAEVGTVGAGGPRLAPGLVGGPSSSPLATQAFVCTLCLWGALMVCPVCAVPAWGRLGSTWSLQPRRGCLSSRERQEAWLWGWPCGGHGASTQGSTCTSGPSVPSGGACPRAQGS